jgi:hypothetical protein
MIWLTIRKGNQRNERRNDRRRELRGEIQGRMAGYVNRAGYDISTCGCASMAMSDFAGISAI